MYIFIYGLYNEKNIIIFSLCMCHSTHLCTCVGVLCMQCIAGSVRIHYAQYIVCSRSQTTPV